MARDQACDLDRQGALAPKGTISYAAITDPRGVGELLRAIDGYDGQRTTFAAASFFRRSVDSYDHKVKTRLARPCVALDIAMT